MRLVVIASVAAALGIGCAQGSVFTCSSNADCALANEPGFCESEGFCSFNDAACPSGRRFGTLAGNGLADECVAGAEPATSTTGMTTSSGTTQDSTTSTTTTTTTLTSSSTLDPTTTSTTGMLDDSGSSETGTTIASDSSSSSETGSTTTTGPLELVCQSWDFSDGTQPFNIVDDGGDISVESGRLTVTWPPGVTGQTTFLVLQDANVGQASIEANLGGPTMISGGTVGLRVRNGDQIFTLGLDASTLFASYWDGSSSHGVESGPAPADLAALRIDVDGPTADFVLIREDGSDLQFASDTQPAWTRATSGIAEIFLNRYDASDQSMVLQADDVEACSLE